jgi:hypothetical protein
MAIMTTAGSTLGVSATLPATNDAAGFGALTFTNVGEITNLGEFGKVYNLVSFVDIGNRRTRKLKGSYNNGSMQLQMARDTSDAGQQELLTALASDASYAFCVTLQNGTKEYFTAKVMDYKTNLGGVDTVSAASTTLEIDSDIVEV